MNKTISYYNENYQKLLIQYDNAKMEDLNKIFNKLIYQHSYVLDIGFGSGRDLNYIKNITKNIYGLDGSIEFVNNLKKDNFYRNRVAVSHLPSINTQLFNINKFDIIISITRNRIKLWD